MGNVFYFDWEVDLMVWLQTNLGDFGLTLVKAFTWMGEETVTLFLFLALYFCYKKEVGKRVGFTVMSASVWFPMIKNVALRLRPYMVHENVQCLAIPEEDADLMDVAQQGYSFPSGHAATSSSIYLGIAEAVRKRWVTVLCILLPLLIGCSRFIMGVHYPTDVLMGWGLGLLALGFSSLLRRWVKSSNVRNLILLATALPGVFFCTSRDYFTALGVLIGMVIAFPVEEKFVNFEDTRKPLYMIHRIIGGALLYLVLNTLLKLPFSEAFLNDGSMASMLVRTARYAVIVALIAGVYPKFFPCFHLKKA